MKKSVTKRNLVTTKMKHADESLLAVHQQDIIQCAGVGDPHVILDDGSGLLSELGLADGRESRGEDLLQRRVRGRHS